MIKLMFPKKILCLLGEHEWTTIAQNNPTLIEQYDSILDLYYCHVYMYCKYCKKASKYNPDLLKMLKYTKEDLK